MPRTKRSSQKKGSRSKKKQSLLLRFHKPKTHNRSRKKNVYPTIVYREHTYGSLEEDAEHLGNESNRMSLSAGKSSPSRVPTKDRSHFMTPPPQPPTTVPKLQLEKIEIKNILKEIREDTSIPEEVKNLWERLLNDNTVKEWCFQWGGCGYIVFQPNDKDFTRFKIQYSPNFENCIQFSFENKEGIFVGDNVNKSMRVFKEYFTDDPAVFSNTTLNMLFQFLKSSHLVESVAIERVRFSRPETVLRYYLRPKFEREQCFQYVVQKWFPKSEKNQ